jgi:hypothetical protein
MQLLMLSRYLHDTVVRTPVGIQSLTQIWSSLTSTRTSDEDYCWLWHYLSVLLTTAAIFRVGDSSMIPSTKLSRALTIYSRPLYPKLSCSQGFHSDHAMCAYPTFS